MRFRLPSGLGLHYTSRGAGRAIALLHPIGVGGSFWAPIAEILAHDFRVLCLDLRGHGSSDFSRDAFTLDDLAADVAEWLDAVGGPRPVLAGCSLGAMVSLGVALRAPDLLGGVVLADGAATLPPEARAMMGQRAAAARDGMPRVLETTLARWFSPAFRERAPAEVERIAALLLAGDPIVHARTWTAIGGLDYAPRLGQVRAPALAVCGELDVSTPPAASKAIAAAIPGARYLELAGAAHMAPLERAAEFAAALAEFVARDART